MDINLVINGARRLSVDVANLNFRLAMLEAEREAMLELVMQLTPGLWERPDMGSPFGDQTDKPAPWVKIEGEQARMLDQLIMMFHDLA